MALPERVRRLIVNADDFGRSTSINQAVIRAHREGILTTASLMINEPAAGEAVALAKENSKLGVGLHLTLACGHSALPHSRIPNLVGAANQFTDNAIAAGFRYFFSRRARAQIHDELEAQFEKFNAAGLKLDHVNGHLNLQLHPAIFDILMEHAKHWGIQHFRLTDDLFRLNARIASGQWLYRFSHAVIYRTLSARARPVLAGKGIRHTERVFGLLQNARVDEPFVQRLLPLLPQGDSELYSHPSLDEFRREFDALISPEVRCTVEREGIQLIRYQDL